MKKNDSDDWQARFGQMEEELLKAREERQNAQEERDALRAVIKGEASPEALDSIEKTSGGGKPMRLMSGEEYRNWVQESISRRLTGLISAIGAGGLIGIASLGTIYVKNTVESNVKTEVGELQSKMQNDMDKNRSEVEQHISDEVENAIIKSTGLVEMLTKSAEEEKVKISEKIAAMAKEEATKHSEKAVEEMVKIAADDPRTIIRFTNAIQEKGGIQKVVAKQFAETFHDESTNEIRKIQALRMLDLLDAEPEIQKIQGEILNDSESPPDLRREVLEVFRPWKDEDKDPMMRDHMLSEFLEDPKCDHKASDYKLFDARRKFLTKLGPKHAQSMRDFTIKEEKPYCLVAEALAAMQDLEGVALKELLAMSRSEKSADAAWKNLGSVENVSDDATRHEALRAAWEQIQKAGKLNDFKEFNSDSTKIIAASPDQSAHEPDAEPVSEIQTWLRGRIVTKKDPNIPESEDTFEGGLEGNGAFSYRLFVQILKKEDWDPVIVAMWPTNEALEAAHAETEPGASNGGVGRAAAKKKDESKSPKQVLNLNRQLLGALIIDHAQGPDRDGLLIDKLVDLVLTDETYLSQPGLCRILAYAMKDASAETLKHFMTSVGERLNAGEVNPEPSIKPELPIDNSHQVELLAAALKRDQVLDENRLSAAIHLVDAANNSSGNKSEFHALLFPAFLAAADGDHRSLVEQINRHLEAEGEGGAALRRHGLELCRLLLASSDEESIKAVEDENLYVSIGAFQNIEQDKDLLGMASDISSDLVTKINWLGDIPTNTELLPPNQRAPFDKKLPLVWKREDENKWFRLKLKAGSEYRIEVTGGPAEMTLVGANQVMVLDRFYFTEKDRHALPTGQLVGERYLRLRRSAADGMISRSDSGWEIHTYQIPRLGISHEQKNAPVKNPGHYADYFRSIHADGGWISFNAKAKNRYFLETTGGHDTALVLYDNNLNLLRKSESVADHGAILQWVCLNDAKVFGKVEMIKTTGKEQPAEIKEQPFELSLTENEPEGWTNTKTRKAGDSEDEPPTVSSGNLTKGLLVQVDPIEKDRDSLGYLKIPARRGQIVEMQSTSSVYLSGQKDFPRLSVEPASKANFLERSIWWITEEAELAQMKWAGNLFVKMGIKENAATFIREESPENPLSLSENRRFISQSLDAGDWYLPLQGEAGKRYRLSFLGETPDCEMEIRSSEGGARPIGGSWNPSEMDLIWEPDKGDIYQLRLTLARGPSQILFQAKGDTGNSSSDSFKGLQAGYRVKLGPGPLEDDALDKKHYQAERAGSGAIVLRLMSLPDGELAILDAGFGSERPGERFLWSVSNLKPAVKFVTDRPRSDGSFNE